MLRSSAQPLYIFRPEYKQLVRSAAACASEGYGPDWYAQNDIERPALVGRLIEVQYKYKADEL